MIHFNELRITDNHLIIDISVLEETYYDNVFLDSIIIDNQDTYVGNGPSSHPVYSYTIPDEVSKFTQQSVSRKHFRIELGIHDINPKDLLFVYIVTKGTPAADTPCGLDNSTTLGVVADMLPFYNQGMQYTKSLSNNCSISQDYIDFILKLNALKLSIKTGNYTKAIEYFKSFNSKMIYKNGGCSCGNH